MYARNTDLPVSPVLGQMMDEPLLVSGILEYAARHFGTSEIVSRRVEGDVHRYTWRDCRRRTCRLANALTGLGVTMGERVATLAWNGYRHLEAYYGVSGIGAVLHTINPRLHPEQIAWIVNHADDQYLLFDLTFLPIVEAIAPLCPGVKGWVLLADADRLPAETRIPNLVSYEALLAAQPDAQLDDYAWPLFDERSAASLCYTSGTTGNPKGALYSHRSTVLHAYGSAMPNALNVAARDVVLPVVPMFHVNAWGLPYSVPLSGAKLVFPGPALDGKSLFALFEAEGVTFSAGVPTVWLGLVNYMKEHGLRFSTFRRTVIGGAACPPALMDALIDEFAVEVVHAWGMTEMSPLGTTCMLTSRHAHLAPEAQREVLRKQGHAIYGVDMRIVDDAGLELPWDGTTFGHLQVKGPWVIESYFREEHSALRDGWFPTGDVATIDADGYMRITDRSKDVIKSGGEWIGTIDLENIAMAHPAVLQAACIGMPHPKWDERPLLVVVPRPGMSVTREELLGFYDGKIARWWLPDDVVFTDSLPVGGTGKVRKTDLRTRFAAHRMADVSRK